ncbi:MAG: adenylosuccinate synthase [Eubacteriales bacterium]
MNWGDEGKGRMVDLLASDYDIVVRYQGGNNAGHTVVNEKGEFILNLLPSGIIRDETVCVMGPGMVIDLEHLVNEIRDNTKRGLTINPSRLKISDKAVICMPYHKHLDEYEEDRLAGNAYGSTRRGIAPVYSDKYMKKALKMGDLLDPAAIEKRLAGIIEWKNLTVVNGYGKPAVTLEETVEWLQTYGSVLRDYVCDTTAYMKKAIDEGKSVMFEAQLGALRDIDFGIYPFTSSSSTIAAYAPVGAGIPFAKLDETIGIMKAYSSCVGAGPFTCELKDATGNKIREIGHEFGAATKRPRRVGGFDVPASRYGVLMQAPTALALTKLDILSAFEKIPVCVRYRVDGVETDTFPTAETALNNAQPVYEYLDGWMTDISGCRSFDELPENAKKYIRYIEKAVDCPIKYVSVGAEREQYFIM